MSVTGDITVVGGNIDTKVAFKNCHPFVKSEIHLNNEHVEGADNLDLIMNMYNLIECSDNYSDSTASLYQYKRKEQNYNNNGNIIPLTVAGSSSFKYESELLGKPTNLNDADALRANTNPKWENAQSIVPLKYISSFFRSLELPLINTKFYIQLNYTKNSVISTGGNDDVSTFKITKIELYVPVVTLKTENNNKLNNLLDGEFDRTFHWNEYKSKIETITQAHNDNNFKRTLLDTAIPGVNRLFVAGFNDNDNLEPGDANDADANRVKRDSHQKYFLPRVDIKDYNVLIDGRNFYDKNISDDFKKYEELRKAMTGRCEDFTTGSLLDYGYWKENYKLICCDLSKQKVLYSNPKANQQGEFVYKLELHLEQRYKY